MKRVIFHRRLRLPEGNYLVSHHEVSKFDSSPAADQDRSTEKSFPNFSYPLRGLELRGTCQQMSASENAPNHWKALVTGRPEPARLQRLASALAFSTPSGIQMPSGL